MTLQEALAGSPAPRDILDALALFSIHWLESR